LSVPNAERIFFIRHAFRAGFTIEEIFNLTKICSDQDGNGDE
jgi:DNA-binding transcriptional MerR regulator